MRFQNKTKFDKKGIIFDLDDTIAQTKQGKNIGLRLVALKIFNYLKEKKIKTDIKRIQKEIYNTSQEMDSKRIYDRNFWWSAVIKKFLSGKSQKSFLDELTKTYWLTVMEKGRLYQDTISVLTYLKEKNYLLGLITDTDGLIGSKTKRIQSLNLEKWFNAIVVAGEDIKSIKPDKAAFLLIAKKLKLKPKECLLVGNELYQDISGAKKSGMSAILIKRRANNKNKIKPDKIIKKLSELKEIL